MCLHHCIAAVAPSRPLDSESSRHDEWPLPHCFPPLLLHIPSSNRLRLRRSTRPAQPHNQLPSSGTYNPEPCVNRRVRGSFTPPIQRPILFILGRHCMPEKRTTLIHSLVGLEMARGREGDGTAGCSMEASPHPLSKTWTQSCQPSPAGSRTEQLQNIKSKNPMRRALVQTYPAHQPDRTTSRQP